MKNGKERRKIKPLWSLPNIGPLFDVRLPDKLDYQLQRVPRFHG